MNRRSSETCCCGWKQMDARRSAKQPGEGYVQVFLEGEAVDLNGSGFAPNGVEYPESHTPEHAKAHVPLSYPNASNSVCLCIYLSTYLTFHGL